LPGLSSSQALAALLDRAHGRLNRAHSDLAGYSGFKEADTTGSLPRNGLHRTGAGPKSRASESSQDRQQESTKDQP
jgi:hypothetical protein